MSSSPVPPLQSIALAASTARTQEQRRAPAARIQTDPLAHRFVSGWRARWPLAEDEATTSLCLHRHLDENMARFLADPAPAQVVLLDAGYDCRAWRFSDALGRRRLFEVDSAATLTHKEEVLERRALPTTPRVLVPLSPEVSLQGALRKAGLRGGMRTLFLWEAGAILRTRAGVKAILSSLAALAGPNSMLVMGAWCWPDAPVPAPRTHLLGAPLAFSLHPEDAGPLLRRHGFNLAEVAATDELRRRYVPDDRPLIPGVYAVTARLRPREPASG